MTHPWHPIPGGVTAPQGFLASGITAGLKASGNPDLSLLLAPPGAVCAGTFTTSVVRAACVDLCAERLAARGGRARAVLTNSGQANACTGERGLIDSLGATGALAERLGLAAEEVLICSTGVIGVPIPMETLLAGLDPLVAALSPEGGDAAARAILTTDLIDKQIALEADLGGRRVRIGGMAKGSGMIHPTMATMLAMVSCDAGLPAELWQAMVQRAVDRSFNAITVDGDTSTNDCFLAFAAGEPLGPEHFDALEAGQAREKAVETVADQGRLPGLAAGAAGKEGALGAVGGGGGRSGALGGSWSAAGPGASSKGTRPPSGLGEASFASASAWAASSACRRCWSRNSRSARIDSLGEPDRDRRLSRLDPGNGCTSKLRPKCTSSPTCRLNRRWLTP